MRNPEWNRLFPEDDFRWSMSLRPGNAADFFSPSATADKTLALRRALILNHGEHYAVLPPGADDLVAVALEHFSEWTGRRFRNGQEAGSELEPDWVLLRPDETGTFRVEGGVVCFPSRWSLPEKAGRPMEAVHAPVPVLNESLGRQIGTFLERLTVGAKWERENWGFSADPDLDHHPRLPRSELTGTESLEQVWLRLERQLFVRLSDVGVLFGIRVSNHRLDELVGVEPGLAGRIARALRTMPDEVAAYKDIAPARAAIAERLATTGLIE